MRRGASSLEERARGLRECTLFAELGEDDLAALSEACSLRLYSGGEVLFHGNTPADGFHVVMEGEVKVCRYGTDGREQVLHMLGAGEPCGEVPVFEGKTYPATAEALRNTKTLYLSREGFLELGQRRPGLLFGMLALLSRRLRRFVELIDDLSLKEVATRVAGFLLELSEQAGGVKEVELDSTKTVLASRLGTISETLSRTLARMQRQDIIEVHGRVITILDHGRLQDLAQGEKL